MFFVDNSVSMDGYLAGSSDFKDALVKAYALARYGFDVSNVSLVLLSARSARRLTPSETELGAVLGAGSAAWTAAGPSRNASPLNEMLQVVLDSLGDSRVCVFVSDCIYSLQGGGNTVDQLYMQKNGTLSAFLAKLKRSPFLTYITRLTSPFTGTYYDARNGKHQLRGAKRPYFLWVLGHSASVAHFMKTVKPASLHGYENTACFTAAPFPPPPYNILLATGVVGRLRPDRAKTAGDVIMGLEDASPVNHQFGFQFAMDLSGIPLDENYLTDSSNIASQNGYRLRIRPLEASAIQPTDRARLRTVDYTHVVEALAATTGSPEPVVFELRKNVPRWVGLVSLEDDTGAAAPGFKTFALDKLVA
jgi:hypothetical protein